MRYAHLVFLVACAPDTFATEDAATDGAMPPDAGCPAADFCSTQMGVPFCNDFDVGAFPWNVTPWNLSTDPDAVGNLTLSATQKTFKSCPTSLDLFIPQQTASPAVGAFPHNYLEGTVPVSSAVVHFDIDVNLPEVSNTDGVTFFALYANNPAWTVDIEHHTGGGWYLVVHQGVTDAGATEMTAPITPTLGVWTHMSLIVDFAVGGTAGATLGYAAPDGGAGTATVTANTLAMNAAVQNVHLDLGGSVYTQTGSSYAAYYDNVVVH